MVFIRGKEMRVTLERRQAIEKEKEAKAERAWERRKSRLCKMAKGAEISFSDGWVCLTFLNGQVFKCRGKGPEEVFGYAPE
jgi:hypothetical protein